MPGPKFVFAHIIAPHPPFLFGADGRPRQSDGAVPFTFSDGDHFLGSRAEYETGYREQTNFVIQRLKRTLETLLKTGGRDSVVVVHGDHGPGRELRWESVEETNVAERFQIFAAYRLPDADGPLSLESPINVTRTLAREYFGKSLPPVADKSFYSRWSRPFDFVEIDALGTTKGEEKSGLGRDARSRGP
jgi:hypothetical protein